MSRLGHILIKSIFAFCTATSESGSREGLLTASAQCQILNVFMGKYFDKCLNIYEGKFYDRQCSAGEINAPTILMTNFLLLLFQFVLS